MSKRNILITGGSGIIGSLLIQALKEKNSIYYISRKYIDDSDIIHIPIDLSDDFRPSDLPKKIDAIVHLAQSENFRSFPEKAIDIFYVNTLSTLKLLDYAKKSGVKNFIYTSSGGVSNNNDRNFFKNGKMNSAGDLNFYFNTKLCSEIIMESYSSFFNVIVLRLFFVYGSHQKSTMLIPRLIEYIKRGEKIVLNGYNGIKINPIHVSDVVNSITRAVNLKKNCRIDIAGPEVLSLREIAITIGQTLKIKPRFKILTDTGPLPNLIGDIAKMKKLLESPRIKFQDGIDQMVHLD